MYQEMINIKSIVEELMLTDPKCRGNNDKWLYFEVLRLLGIDLKITYEQTKNMICPETVRRVRQKFQEVDKIRLRNNPHLKPIFLPDNYGSDVVDIIESEEDSVKKLMSEKTTWGIAQ